MSELRYPNESPDYRKARDELLEEEKALVERVKAVAEKRRNLQLIQMHSKRLFILQERFEQHFPSEITVRGVVYPGVVLRSHGRQREIKSPLREVVFFFNTTRGRIEEKALNG